MIEYTVDNLLKDVHLILEKNEIREGLEAIREKTELLLKQSNLLEKYVDMDSYRGRTIIGHDPEVDTYVIIHGGLKGGKSSPHDHGPCSVIYGNYTGHTLMRRWNRIDNGGAVGPAQLKLVEEYIVNSGKATAFGPGDIHSIDYPDGAFFIRVTLGDVEKQKTCRFDLEKGIVEIANRANQTR